MFITRQRDESPVQEHFGAYAQGAGYRGRIFGLARWLEQIECWGCLKQFDKSHIRYFQPFAGGARRDEKNFEVIQTFGAVTEEPQTGAKPYCPECLKGHLAD